MTESKSAVAELTHDSLAVRMAKYHSGQGHQHQFQEDNDVDCLRDRIATGIADLHPIAFIPVNNMTGIPDDCYIMPVAILLIQDGHLMLGNDILHISRPWHWWSWIYTGLCAPGFPVRKTYLVGTVTSGEGAPVRVMLS